MARFILVDDGTMDTVVECMYCGEQLRYNYAAEDADPDDDYTYNEFVSDCLLDAREIHECDPQDEE